LAATAGLQQDGLAQQNESDPEAGPNGDQNNADSLEAAVDFVDCNTVEIEGSFETVTVHGYTYESDGIATFVTEFGPVDGTTTLPPETFEEFSTGLNGYLIPFVRLSGGNDQSGEVDNPNEDSCDERIRPEQVTVEFVEATPVDTGTIAATFSAENPNDEALQVSTVIESGATETEPPGEYGPGESEFTVEWTPVEESEKLVVTADLDPFGRANQRAETPTASEIFSGAANGFSPDISVECYSVQVDAEAYDSVELVFADRTTVTFDDGYSGATEFGFSGDGTIDADSETAVDEFYGPIEQVVVTAEGATETVTREGRCGVEAMEFNCDSYRYTGSPDDVRVSFVDGSDKMWDGPATPDQVLFGSPGRVIESLSEESIDIEFENPNQDCDPGEYATVFDCTEVTIGESEFTTDPPTFERVTLNFVDDTSQSFGERGAGPVFTAPETFTGVNNHELKIIESIMIETLDGDIVFELVNPTVDDCEPVDRFEPTIVVDTYSVRVGADSYDRVVCEFSDGATETFDGEFSGSQQFGYAGAEALWDAPADQTVEEFHGPIERCQVEQGESVRQRDFEVEKPAITGVAFDCSTVECTGTARDIRLYYGDGSFDWYESEQSGTVRFGSPGRLLGGVYFADQGLWLSNPTRDCEPEPNRMAFNCRAVRITADEFGPEPGTINRLQLIFDDGTNQVFGSQDPDATAFETPAVFSGIGDHAGKVITQLICELPGREAFFVRTNPDTDGCEPAPPEETDQSENDESTPTGAAGGVTALAESESEAVSSAEAVVEVDSGDPLRAPPPNHPQPATENQGAVEIREPEVETDEGLLGRLPWWGWVTAAGGVGGTVSYLVARALGSETDEQVDTEAASEAHRNQSDQPNENGVDPATLDERATGVDEDTGDETPDDDGSNRWDRFGEQ
jgi:hypothetical protein